MKMSLERKKRRVKPKVIDSESKLRRKTGEIVIVEETVVSFKSRRLSLLDIGGRGGQDLIDDKFANNKRDYFLSSNNDKCNYSILLPTVAKREIINKDVFRAVKREIYDHIIVEENENESETNGSTNRICSLQKQKQC